MAVAKLSLPSPPNSTPHNPPEPSPESLVGDLVESYLKSRGVPADVAQQMTTAAESAARRVPHWVIYLAFFLGGPLCVGIWGQYQTYKDLPTRMGAVEQQLKAQEDIHLEQSELLKHILGILEDKK